MAYQINFTDGINKEPLVVEDNTINESTSLSFPGRNSTGYGQIVGENFLHLLENFANETPPQSPVQGQLWFDTTDGVSQLKVNIDGTDNGWASSGGLKRGNLEPSGANSIVGDLWVNTDTQQLYLFTGTGWILIGPQFSTGSKTGAEPEVLIDTQNNPQSVVSQYVVGERVAIISKTEFTSKTVIPGFSLIRAGINLNSNYNKYWGTAEKAEALLVGNSVVPASNFLRSDITSNTDFPINIKNSRGLAVGEDSQLTMTIDGTAGVLFHKTTGSNFDIRVNNNGVVRTVIRVDSSSRVGVNNLNPQESLDVTGNIQSSGKVIVNDTTESVSTSSGSAIFSGGVGIAKNLTVGGKIALSESIVPLVNLASDIGEPDYKINDIYSNRIFASVINSPTIVGTVQGNLIGNAQGTSSSFASDTQFVLDGDITSTAVSFGGPTNVGGVKTFTTQLSETFITDKTPIVTINDLDEFIVNRGIQGLRKITKKDLWNAIARTPVATVVSYAGSVAPSGWLLCDGSEVLISEYSNLFDVIGYTYGDRNTLLGLGTFKLPDFRGRMPLGLDNMTSGKTVPAKTNPDINIITGGGSANRVTDPEADSLGLGGGTEAKTIEISNLPDHEHDMRGNDNNQYYAFRNISGAPSDTDAISGQGSLTNGLGQYLPTSGGVLTNPPGTFSQSALNVMNPYLSMNFIIYTGTDV